MRDARRGPRAPSIVCGRFEGVDERVIEARGLEEVSIGDYVLSGGEIAAMVLLDACVRLLPGVMGKDGLRDARRASRAISSNTRTTPGRANGRAGRSRTSSSAATTPRSRAGAREAERQRHHRASGGRICLGPSVGGECFLT